MNKIFEIDGEPCATTLTDDGVIAYRKLEFTSKTATSSAMALLNALNYLIYNRGDSILIWRSRPTIIKIEHDKLNDVPLDEHKYSARCRLAFYPELDKKHWEFVETL